MTVSNRFQNFTMTLPGSGPVSVPDSWSFAAGERTEIDLSQLINNGWMDFVSGVYVDNTENDGYLLIECFGTNQKFYVGARSSGYYPLLLPNPPKCFVTSLGIANVLFQWYNMPVFPLVINDPTNQGPGSNVNISAIAGTPLATPEVPVTGPLTDTELRASAVPVSVAASTGVALTSRGLTLNGASQTLVTAGQAARYLLVQNPTGNGDIKINIANGDALTVGIVVAGGGSYENTVGISNAVTVSGTNTQTINAFAG